MAMTAEQIDLEIDKLLKQAAAYSEMQAGDKRLKAFDAADIERRLSILRTQKAVLAGTSSGYVTRFYTR